MGKSVTIDAIPYVPCSKMKTCDLGSMSKSLEAARVKLEALTKGYGSVVHTRSTTSSHGVPREPKPPDLCRGEHHLLRQGSKSSPALRGKGNTPTLPFFNGQNSRAFVSWLYDVECYFESHCFSEKRKLEMVVSCLKGFALMWYHALNLSRTMEGKGRIRSWFKLEMKMRLKFLPCSTMNDLWAEFKTLKQNSLSVVEYAKLFEELCFVCDKEVDFVLGRIRFYLGLKSEIARRINLERVYSYDELLELALGIEKSLTRPENNEVLAKGDSLEETKIVGVEESLDQGVVMPCLGIACPKSKSLEPKIMSACGEMNSSCDAIFNSPCPEIKTPFNPTHEHTSEEESNHVLSHQTIDNQATDLGTREVIVDQGILDLQNRKFGQSMVMFKGGTCWESIKGEARRESWVVPYLSVPNLTSYTSHGSCFKNYILEGRLQPQSSLGPDLSKNFGYKRVFDPGGTRHRTILKDDDDCSSEHILLVIQLKFRAKQPRPLVDGYMTSIERKVGMGISGNNKPFIGMKSPTLFAEFNGGTHIQPSQATMNFIPRKIRSIWMSEQSEIGNGTIHLLPFTIRVYDPGGRHDNWSLEVVFKLERA